MKFPERLRGLVSRPLLKPSSRGYRIFTRIGMPLALIAALLYGSAGIAGAPSEPPALKLAQQQDCFSCHAIDHDVVGPAWLKIAQTYAGQPAAATVLTIKVMNGGVGHWGTVPMPAHPKLSEADAKEIVNWILSLKGNLKKEPAQTYTYKDLSGKAVTVDFPVFNDKHQVTDDIFGGYEKYNSYCFRCHGPDAVGGEYAPDLRKSLQNGMSRRDFFIIAMEGKKAKGMPDWAGFFTADEMEQIYEYVKVRQLNLVAPGRPPSKND